MKYGKKGIKSYDLTSLLARGVWIEIFGPFGRAIALAASLLARGVWIEITKQALDSLGTSVTPRKGSVN